MPDRWETILSIFDVVRDAPTAERPALLLDRCGSNGDLRAEVESLLEHDVRAEPAFLAPQEFGEFRTDQADPLIGCVVAGYTIKGAIARGGMGTVFLAEQEKPRRDVALKVLQAAFWTRSAEKRFDAESHILGYLRHSNIAQVYEAGTHRSETGATIHYFAMEYVPDARPITKYADEQSLTQKARLELFLQLCDAVAYGHQKGVIHRDLKPANVLVGTENPRSHPDPPLIKGRESVAVAPQDSRLKSQALLKVIDFGIARTVDSDIAATTMHTEAGQLLGTLAYMSPEQCAADPSQIDTTTDIYSLGVILYELLTGRMPYDVSNMTIQSAARIICEQEPRRPSTFKRSDRGSIPSPYEGEGKGGVIRAGFQPVKGDLETIILKAIEKSRAKRYQSVSDLSNEVQRLINGEPISARSPTAYSKLLRWAARHPRATPALSGLAIAALMVAVSAWSIHVVRTTPGNLVLTKNGQAWDILKSQPVHDGNQAALISVSGETLDRWETVSDLGGITFAKRIPRPALWGGGEVSVLGFGPNDGGANRGKLCIFDVPKEPAVHQLYVSQSTLDDMPNASWPRPNHDKMRLYNSDDFSVKKAWVFDIFDDEDCPGQEIVAFFQHRSYSQGVLRIYNLNGDILFAAWQDGGIYEAGWLPAARLLVCIAPKADRDEPSMGDPSQSRHPHVIFAIRPTKHGNGNAWIFPVKPNSWQCDWLKPDWYKAFCPLRRAPAWQFVVSMLPMPELSPQFSHDSHLLLMFEAAESNRAVYSGYNFKAVVDANGSIVNRPAYSDGVRQWLAAHPDSPNPQDLQLVDWKTQEFPCTQPSTP